MLRSDRQFSKFWKALAFSPLPAGEQHFEHRLCIRRDALHEVFQKKVGGG